MMYGMEISLSISRLKLSGPTSLVQIAVAYSIKLDNTSFSVIPFIIAVLTTFFDDVSLMMKLRKLSITVTLEHVAVICLGMPLPKRYYERVIYGLLCLRTASLLLRNAMLSKLIITTHPTSLHHVVSIGPFTKWGIDFMTCNPHSVRGHGYIIVAVDYFTKWAEAMPKFDNTGKTAALFIFNHIITRFGIPQAIITNHGSHFRNFMMSELMKKLGLRHENSTPYYP
jgi:hypothetical protein